MKRIVLTGGGTAGHVTPNIALIPRLKELHYDIQYIGSYNGIEKELISQLELHKEVMILDKDGEIDLETFINRNIC